MSDITVLTAQARERAGKGPARAARRAGLVPGVIYGAKKDPSMIALEGKPFNKELNAAGFFAQHFGYVGVDTVLFKAEFLSCIG